MSTYNSHGQDYYIQYSTSLYVYLDISVCNSTNKQAKYRPHHLIRYEKKKIDMTSFKQLLRSLLIAVAVSPPILNPTCKIIRSTLIDLYITRFFLLNQFQKLMCLMYVHLQIE